MSRRNPRAARFGRPYRYTAKGRPRWFVRAYRAKRWSNPRRYRRLRRRRQSVFVRVTANVQWFTKALASVGVTVAKAMTAMQQFAEATARADQEGARRVFYQLGLADRADELLPAAYDLYRRTGMPLWRAAEVVGTIAARATLADNYPASSC